MRQLECIRTELIWVLSSAWQFYEHHVTCCIWLPLGATRWYLYQVVPTSFRTHWVPRVRWSLSGIRKSNNLAEQSECNMSFTFITKESNIRKVSLYLLGMHSKQLWYIQPTLLVVRSIWLAEHVGCTHGIMQWHSIQDDEPPARDDSCMTKSVPIVQDSWFKVNAISIHGSSITLEPLERIIAVSPGWHYFVRCINPSSQHPGCQKQFLKIDMSYHKMFVSIHNTQLWGRAASFIYD